MKQKNTVRHKAGRRLLIPVLYSLVFGIYFIILSYLSTIAPVPEVTGAIVDISGEERELPELEGESVILDESWSSELGEKFRLPIEWELKSVYCDKNSDKISEDSYAVIDEIVKDLKYRNNLLLIIEGNCADDGNGNTVNLILLSEKRAEFVAGLLIAGGVEPVQLITVGNGITNPVNTDNSVEELQKNRRIDIIVKEIEPNE